MELTKKEIAGLKKHWGRQVCKPIPQDKFEEKCKALDLMFWGEIAQFYSYGLPCCNAPKFYWNRHDAIVSLGYLHRPQHNYKVVLGIDDLVKVNFDDLESIVQDIQELQQAHKTEQVKQEKITDLQGQYNEGNLQKKLNELGLDGQYRIHKDSNWVKIYGNGLTISLRASALFQVISNLETADLGSFFKIIKLLGLKGKLDTK